MKSKKIIIVFIMLMLCSIFICKEVQAVKINVGINEEEVKAGEEVKITLKTTDLSDNELINVLQGKIEYNKKDWEILTNDKIKVKNNWSVIFNEDTNEFVLINIGGTSSEEEVCEITLKAKEKLINTKANIKVTNLNTTDGTEMIDLGEINQTIKIEGKLPILVIVVLLVAIIAVLMLIAMKIKNKDRIK